MKHAIERLSIAGLVGICAGCTGDRTPTPADTRLTVPAPVEHLAAVAVREPMVVEHPGGALFVAGYTQAIEESGQPPKLFVSRDAGASWEAVDVGTPEQGAVGNSDVDLAVAPDGTLYFLTLGFNRMTGEGTHVAVGVSRDVGESWTWAYLSQDRFDDRPWIGVAPDGVVHVIWNDGEGVSHAISTDAGRTWQEQPRIHQLGGSSHLAVGPDGQIAVRITPRSAAGNRFDAGVDLIAVSLDGGATWEKLAPPGTRDWNPDPSATDVLPRWVEPLAWDADGALYHLWSEGSDLWLGRSTDHGQTWESRVIVLAEEPLYFPYLAARGSGELAATWFSDSGENLRAHVALIDVNQPAGPLVRSADPLQLESWRPAGDSVVRDPAGEYLPVVFLSDGDLGVVTPIQNALENRNGFSWYRISH